LKVSEVGARVAVPGELLAWGNPFVESATLCGELDVEEVMTREPLPEPVCVGVAVREIVQFPPGSISLQVLEATAKAAPVTPLKEVELMVTALLEVLVTRTLSAEEVLTTVDGKDTVEGLICRIGVPAGTES
jgi:hypothetical protein